MRQDCGSYAIITTLPLLGRTSRGPTKKLHYWYGTPSLSLLTQHLFRSWHLLVAEVKSCEISIFHSFQGLNTFQAIKIASNVKTDRAPKNLIRLNLMFWIVITPRCDIAHFDQRGHTWLQYKICKSHCSLISRFVIVGWCWMERWGQQQSESQQCFINLELQISMHSLQLASVYFFALLSFRREKTNIQWKY